MNKAEIRNEVVLEFKSLVFGPRGGEKEFIEGARGVTLRYLAGILFPKGQKRSDLAGENEAFAEDTEKQAGKSNDDFSGDNDNPLSMANEELPSSVGISFVIRKGATFRILVDAAQYVYEDIDGVKGYRRSPLNSESIESKKHTSDVTIFSGKANISIIRRYSNFRDDCEVITVSLINNQEQSAKGKNATESIEGRLYQVGLCIESISSKIEPYESSKIIGTDLEENILSLQYSDSPLYAVGHGSSVNWIKNEHGDVSHVEVSYLPIEFVDRPLFDKLKVSEEKIYTNKSTFDISRLADSSSSREEIISNFFNLCDFYNDWIDAQGGLKEGVFKDAEDFLLEGMSTCFSRMKLGVERLRDNDEYWDAFVLANKAMLYQIDQNSRLKNLRSNREKEGLSWPVEWNEQIDTANQEFPVFQDDKKPHWRPFQLAFFLTSFLDLEESSSGQKKLVDLIWFSTGGGKTEAYLFLSSYELIRRRIRYGDPKLGYGTGVLTRYTLRFLTSDQFSRTASLGCAPEKIRLENLGLLGDEPFSVGLFVGNQTASYKNVSTAETDLNKLRNAPESLHRFQISECPNCGTGLIPNELTYDSSGEPEGFGIKVIGSSLEYRCVNKKCLFSNELRIPLKVIDEEIYSTPPSFLLGTLDKFAMVPWREKAGAIFGYRNRSKYVVPPSLIIQDELHLISGPLGTISSIYEAAFDQLIKVGQERVGLAVTGPKYIASSATVRDSHTQIRRLMGRESAIFPPPGLRSDDSFFSTADKDQNKARMYMGVMAQGLRATSSAHWVSGALLQSVRYVARQLKSKEELDFLWSTLCYCNSKRELGLINASVNQEILERMKVCAQAQGIDASEVGYLKKEEVSSDGVVSISQTRSNLLMSVSDTEDTEVKDFIPCTNMISVGIDIERLGTIVVNGQPKTTAEYIQATSRVGRNPEGNGPGLVIALYSPAKPRDRSHYEHFKAYHQTLYRLVEPTSVTPGSEPALNRALHAAVVTLIRHGCSGMLQNQKASEFDLDNPDIINLIDKFKLRLLETYPDETESQYERKRISVNLDEIITQWDTWADDDLNYDIRDKHLNSLLIPFVGPSRRSNVGFKTMYSMRGVDAEVKVSI